MKAVESLLREKILNNKRIMKKSIAYVLSRIYGVRGGLKPPLGGCKHYRMKHFIWKHINALYSWSGLPERWDESQAWDRQVTKVMYVAYIAAKKLRIMYERRECERRAEIDSLIAHMSELCDLINKKPYYSELNE